MRHWVGTALGRLHAATANLLRVAFYAFFAPVSYSADRGPTSPGFGAQVGYDADLLTALEAMNEARLSFERIPVSDWPEHLAALLDARTSDIAGGGITILESRTRNEALRGMGPTTLDSARRAGARFGIQRRRSGCLIYVLAAQP